LLPGEEKAWFLGCVEASIRGEEKSMVFGGSIPKKMRKQN
jgi:hypothetical protein